MYAITLGEEILFYHADEAFVRNFLEQYNKCCNKINELNNKIGNVAYNLNLDPIKCGYGKRITEIDRKISESIKENKFELLPELYAEKKNVEKLLDEYITNKLSQVKNELVEFEKTVPDIINKTIKYVKLHNASRDDSDSVSMETLPTFEDFQKTALERF